jgi:hypothetical protein
MKLESLPSINGRACANARSLSSCRLPGLTAARSPEGITINPGETVPVPAAATLPADKVLWMRYKTWQNGVLHYSRISDR